MNNTPINRWNRYKSIGGVLHKKCNGVTHSKGGAWLPLSEFWVFNKGPRKGKPISQCKACGRITNTGNRMIRNPVGGLVPLAEVMPVFHELACRLGKLETCKRLGISSQFYGRAARGVYSSIYRTNADKARELLAKLHREEQQLDDFQFYAMELEMTTREISWREAETKPCLADFECPECLRLPHEGHAISCSNLDAALLERARGQKARSKAGLTGKKIAGKM